MKVYVVYYKVGNRIEQLCHDTDYKTLIKKLRDYRAAGWKINKPEIRKENY